MDSLIYSYLCLTLAELNSRLLTLREVEAKRKVCRPINHICIGFYLKAV